MLKKLAFSKWSRIILGIILGLVAVAIVSVGFFIDVQWFKEVGYFDVFMTKFVASACLVVPIFLVSFIALFIYFRSMKETILSIVGTNKLKIYRAITNSVNLIFSLGLGIVVAFENWREILEFINAQSFGVKDPIFNLDISFYMFKLPIIDSVYQSLFFVLVVMVILTVLVYLATNLQAEMGNSRVIHLNAKGEGILKFAGRQLAVIAAIAMLLFSIGFIIKGFDLVYSPRGVAYGASYTDVKVTLLFFRIISVASVIGAIIVAYGIVKKKIKLIGISIASIVGLIILQPIVAAFVQQVIVKSNELEFEKPYIQYNIDATKEAYGINDIEVKEFNPTNDLNSDKLESNKDIIDNLKVNSAEPVLNFYKQVQLIKNYYTFNDVDTDRYEIDGEYSQVFIAPREIDTSSMDIWQNKHLRYTHGYGLAMSEVNQVTKEGQPSFLMRDIPTLNTANIKVDNPRIYFGESTNDYAIVNTDIVEFDYPDGETENEFKYDGDAGIPMNGLNKLAFAIEYGQPKMVFSGAIKDDSKILINRNIVERAKKIAPFLTYDSDPYPVVYDDRIVWVIDAYTTSDKYPFSEPYNGINYIRNSVKITVDAYTGDINFYVADESDPIIKTYSNVFKGLFKPMAEMPKEIKEHFRYPQDMFNLQTEVLAKYHINDAMKLFTQEDLWDVSGRKLGEEVSEGENQKSANKEVELLYLMSRLHGEENLEMMLFEYFNMKGKQNMVSLLGARMDGDNYGELIMYKFPQQRAIYSPDLFKNRMMQDPDISKEISLWAGKGSEVVYGDIVILPIEDSLLYMNTIYLKAEAANGIPEMKRVVLSNGDKIVIAENVEKALEKLFDYSAKPSEGTDEEVTKPSEGDKPDVGTGKGDFGDAASLFNEAIEAQKSGDWAKYGELINELGNMLNSLSSQQ
ncbi:MAG: UPF0182 family protein [Sarcina sp.]